MHQYRQPIIWISLLLVLSFFVYYQLLNPLPYYSFFSDPELPYLLNSVMLSAEGQVQHTDHPGTFLQITGAVLSLILGIRTGDVFNDNAIKLFRITSQCLSLVLTLWLVVYFWRSLRETTRGWMFACLVALLFADYNSLVYWGTFTPEGAFTVLYIPVMALCLKRFQSRAPASVPGVALLGLLLGLVTTIKLTLWPVTIFVMIVYYTACPGSARFRLGRAGLLCFITAASFLLIGSAFAADRSAQWSWIFALLQNSGRYGNLNEAEPGAFLGFARIFRLTVSGLQLQNFATLIPMGLLGWVALSDAMDRKASNARRIVASGFLLCFLLSWLVFMKHPYQIKYLLVQTPLLAGFWYQRLLAGNGVFPKHFHPVAIVLMLAVVMTSLINHRAVHVVTLAIDRATSPVIDQVIETLDPSMLYFSIEVRHPLAAKAFALREARVFEDTFRENVRPAQVFRERTIHYETTSTGRIPLQSPVPRSLVFTLNPFNDNRYHLVHADNEAGLHIYLCPPES
jgi:hypothetical protein